MVWYLDVTGLYMEGRIVHLQRAHSTIQRQSQDVRMQSESLRTACVSLFGYFFLASGNHEPVLIYSDSILPVLSHSDYPSEPCHRNGMQWTWWPAASTTTVTGCYCSNHTLLPTLVVCYEPHESFDRCYWVVPNVEHETISTLQLHTYHHLSTGTGCCSWRLWNHALIPARHSWGMLSHAGGHRSSATCRIYLTIHFLSKSSSFPWNPLFNECFWFIQLIYCQSIDEIYNIAFHDSKITFSKCDK